MKTSVIKHNVACFLLLLFLSLKMVGLHTLSHTDDEDHNAPCEICSHALVHNLIPALIPQPTAFSIENTTLVFNHIEIISYHFKISSTIASSQLFSRPPPIFV
jgi:hypothetical protein